MDARNEIHAFFSIHVKSKTLASVWQHHSHVQSTQTIVPVLPTNSVFFARPTNEQVINVSMLQLVKWFLITLFATAQRWCLWGAWGDWQVNDRSQNRLLPLKHNWLDVYHDAFLDPSCHFSFTPCVSDATRQVLVRPLTIQFLKTKKLSTSENMKVTGGVQSQIKTATLSLNICLLCFSMGQNSTNTAHRHDESASECLLPEDEEGWLTAKAVEEMQRQSWSELSSSLGQPGTMEPAFLVLSFLGSRGATQTGFLCKETPTSTVTM